MTVAATLIPVSTDARGGGVSDCLYILWLEAVNDITYDTLSRRSAIATAIIQNNVRRNPTRNPTNDHPTIFIMQKQNLTLTPSNLIDGIQDESVLWDTAIVATEEEKELAWSRLAALFALDNGLYQ